MADKKRDTFIFYRSFKESMAELSDKDKLTMYEAIADYSLDMIEPQLAGFPKAMFALIRPILDANLTRWQNGCKGGAPIGNNNARKQPKNNQGTTEKQANKDKDNKIRINNKDISGAKTTRFVPPSLEKIQSFISDNGFSVDAAQFLNFYESKGWLVGKNKMKDWRAAVRNWQRREQAQGSKLQQSPSVGVVLHAGETKYSSNDEWG